MDVNRCADCGQLVKDEHSLWCVRYRPPRPPAEVWFDFTQTYRIVEISPFLCLEAIPYSKIEERRIARKGR